MNFFDLRIHSCYSNDGEFAPQKLIHMADAIHLTTTALSDHGTPKGVVGMVHLGETKGIRVVLAVKSSTLSEELKMYILGYGINYEQPYFRSLFDSLSEREQAVQVRRVEKIREVFDLDADPAAFLKRYAGKNPLPIIVHHIMEQYKDEKKFADHQPRDRRCEPQPMNFYQDIYSAGKPYYVCVKCPSLKGTVQRIHDAGGIAVLTHSWLNFYQKEERPQEVLDERIGGIEACSNYHKVKHDHYYDTYCRQHGVLVTCGSDSHGKMKPKIRMGEYGYEKDDGEDILQASLEWLAK